MGNFSYISPLWVEKHYICVIRKSVYFRTGKFFKGDFSLCAREGQKTSGTLPHQGKSYLSKNLVFLLYPSTFGTHTTNGNIECLAIARVGEEEQRGLPFLISLN